MTAKDGPTLADWMKAVAHSVLDKREKAVLNALLLYIEWGKLEASCHPSIQTLAKACGYSERSLQSAMIDLERTGILRVSEGPPGWKTLTRTLSWTALIAATPAAIAGVKHTNPRSRSGDSPQPLQGSPAAIAPDPRNHHTQSFHGPSMKPANDRQEGADATDGMDGHPPETTRKRQTRCSLAAKGVQGKNLDRLTDCTQVTPNLIEQEWIDIKKAERIRNAPAVLVRRLSEHAGIKMGSQHLLAGMHPAEKRALLESQARLEQRRRDAQLAAP